MAGVVPLRPVPATRGFCPGAILVGCFLVVSRWCGGAPPSSWWFAGVGVGGVSQWRVSQPICHNEVSPCCVQCSVWRFGGAWCQRFTTPKKGAVHLMSTGVSVPLLSVPVCVSSVCPGREGVSRLEACPGQCPTFRSALTQPRAVFKKKWENCRAIEVCR